MIGLKVEYHRKRDGILRIESRYGASGLLLYREPRYLTWWETVIYWCGGNP